MPKTHQYSDEQRKQMQQHLAELVKLVTASTPSPVIEAQEDEPVPVEYEDGPFSEGTAKFFRGDTLQEARRGFELSFDTSPRDTDIQTDGTYLSSSKRLNNGDIHGGSTTGRPQVKVEPRDQDDVKVGDKAGLLFSEDFQDGKIDPRLTWTGAEQGGDRRRIVTLRDGVKCLAHTERKGDPLEAKAHRTETDTIRLKPSRLKDGASIWQAFSVMFPSPYEYSKAETLVAQQKPYKSPPAWLFGQYRNEFRFRGGDGSRSFSVDLTDGKGLEKDIWYHILLGQEMSMRDKNRGLLDLYVRMGDEKAYRRVFTRRGPNMKLSPPAGGETYNKYGNYFPHMDINERTIYIDNIRFGKTRESVEI